jgi:lipopolysaccharide export system protein LptC
MNSKIFFLIIGLVTMGFLIYQGYYSGQPLTKLLSEETSRFESPQFFLRNTILIQYEPSGNPHHLIRAREIDHLPVEDAMLLKEPEYMQFKAHAIDWQINANSGKILEGGDDVVLNDAVYIEQFSPEGELVTRLATDSLVIFSEEQIAETDDPVTITYPQSAVLNKVHAVGMKAWLGEERITLLSRVRGRHEKN